MSNHDHAPSSTIPSPDRPPSDRPSSDESPPERPYSEESMSDSLRSTPEQSPHPEDKIKMFYPGRDNIYGGILPSNLVVWDPETRLSHLQYVAQLSPETTALMTDKTTIVVSIRHEYRNDDSGDRRRCWDIYFGPGSVWNFCQSYPLDNTMTHICGDVHALIYALCTIKFYTLGGSLLSQIYIATDSYSMSHLFTGPSKDPETNPNTGLHGHE
ncbi:uncharacterized protein FTOL_03693 [Fusarium torulosum]|uniref:Uncharacterized protein n=1 Tax=Fusarium torulosum TaxID=33205 RepID=A0AAE8SFH7_9HYPO|nr:uncharacterized protein FTOL_03693 [Fusarium torulosum]